MKREEIIDICQISKARWIIHEAQGKLPLPNKEEYSDTEALTLIKYWRYCKHPKKWSTDMSKRDLAKFLGIHLSTLNHQIDKGNIPQPNKHVGLRHFYTHEAANRIKQTYIKNERPWTRAKEEGYFTPTETARLLGIDNKKLKKLHAPTRERQGRLYYSKRDVRDLKRILRNFDKQNPDSQS